MEARYDLMRELSFHFGSFNTRVSFWHGMLPSLCEVLPRNGTPALVVCDDNTMELGAGMLARESGGSTLALPPGEPGKEWESVAEIYRAAIGHGLSRDGHIVGVGGGVICDVAAFAASTYMRGVSLTLIPTTLLAMVDAALGGKTGFNFGGFKNMIGTFYPAGEVMIVPSVLAGLPEREYKSGIAEVIKSALLGDAELFRFLQEEHSAVLAREPDAVTNIVERSIGVKGAIVEADLTEQGNRAILNLGHTFGHALESVTDFVRFTHGEAVAWGIAQAMRAGVEQGLTDPSYADDVIELIKIYGFETELRDVPLDRFIQAIQYDKKKRGGKARFVLQRALGGTELVELDMEFVRSLLKRYAA